MQLDTQNTVILPLVDPQAQSKIQAAIARFEDVIRRFLGLTLPAAPARAWAKYASLPKEVQEAIVAGINAQADFAEGAMMQGIDAVDEAAMLDYACQKLSLLTAADASTKIQKGDIVEIFDSSHIQVYRSYSCFALCNYSLLELVSYPWYELYDRSTAVTAAILEHSQKIFSGQMSYLPLKGLVPEHTLRELLTEEQGLFKIDEKFYFKMRSTLTGKTYLTSVKRITPLMPGGSGEVVFI